MNPLVANEKERYVAASESVAWRGPAADAWLDPLRRRGREAFAALGFPTTRDEAWKYTDVSPILRHEFSRTQAGCERMRFASLEALQVPEASDRCLVFIDGHYCPELSSVRGLPEGVILGELFGAAASEHGALVRDRLATVAPTETEAFVALNTAMTDGGAFVYVPDGVVLEGAIHVVYLAGGADAPSVAHPRTLVVAGANSAARIIETFAAAVDEPAFTNAVAEFSLAEGARVEHYRIQTEGLAAYHVGSTDVVVGRSASYTSVAVAFGAALSRHDLRVTLAAEGAECRIDGLYVTDSGQHADSHTRVDHTVPHTSSNQLYKGVLGGSSRSVFNGKVVVHHDAQKTVAHQQNRNLLLSPSARVDTKPELEIFADDVVCTHGATVGALEDVEKFYLASRGLDEETARGLLTYGFAEEIVEEIRIESVRRHLDAVLLERFQKGIDR
jgi:Fe-S cluster assembly protein SufD